ncbi:MAG: ornithine cyclodeaminase family protein [Solirubrobacterales bacterium]|nr:ornithine cyclodeaminase family protein [Solirubrobacterales bacterium]
MDVLVLSRAEVERLLDLRALLDALRGALCALTEGTIAAPARNELALSEDESFLLGMPGRRTTGGPVAVKLVTVVEQNLGRGLPSHLATITVHDATTGACRAFLDGTYVTAVRTAATAAVACDALARPDARTLAIVGAGVQGEQHLRTFPLVRAFEDVRIASLHRADAERLAAADPRARAVASAEEAIRGADVVALATHSATPVLDPAWLAPGTHVSSVGYRPPDGELPRALLADARLFVETREAFAPTPVGCAELAGLDPATATEVGEVLLGRRPGRASRAETTTYKAMGHVAEDLAATELVLAAAARDGAGTTVAL